MWRNTFFSAALFSDNNRRNESWPDSLYKSITDYEQTIVTKQTQTSYDFKKRDIVVIIAAYTVHLLQ